MDTDEKIPAKTHDQQKTYKKTYIYIYICIYIYIYIYIYICNAGVLLVHALSSIETTILKMGNHSDTFLFSPYFDNQ